MTTDPTDVTTVAFLNLDDCPCCHHRPDGPWTALCDPCLYAAYTGGCRHDRERGAA